jgi:small subunit ribosomal protein S17
MTSSHVMRSLTQQVKRLNVRTVSTSHFSTIMATRSVGDVTARTEFSASHRQQRQQQQSQTTQQFRHFSNDDGDDQDATSSLIQNTTEYSPAEIMDTFQDTSYFDPIEQPDYSHMTNEELDDTTTIPGWGMIHSPPKDLSIPRGALVGTVVSTKMQKTVNVSVDRFKVHPKYGKRLRFTRKFMAHDEQEVAHPGDLVMIVPSHRMSKHKHFMLREIIRPKGQL